MDDEFDEYDGLVDGTTTYMYNTEDLDSIFLIGTYVADNSGIDHNQYIVGDYAYQSNLSGYV